MPQQQALIGPVSIEGVEKTNTVVVRGQEGQRMGLPRRDPYAMEVDRRRNCYACSRFRHMAQHCRNRGGVIRIGKGRRLKYKERRERNMEHSNNCWTVGLWDW